MSGKSLIILVCICGHCFAEATTDSATVEKHGSNVWLYVVLGVVSLSVSIFPFADDNILNVPSCPNPMPIPSLKLKHDLRIFYPNVRNIHFMPNMEYGLNIGLLKGLSLTCQVNVIRNCAIACQYSIPINSLNYATVTMSYAAGIWGNTGLASGFYLSHHFPNLFTPANLSFGGIVSRAKNIYILPSRLKDELRDNAPIDDFSSPYAVADNLLLEFPVSFELLTKHTSHTLYVSFEYYVRNYSTTEHNPSSYEPTDHYRMRNQVVAGYRYSFNPGFSYLDPSKK
jgi:hypothetical protein